MGFAQDGKSYREPRKFDPEHPPFPRCSRDEPSNRSAKYALGAAMVNAALPGSSMSGAAAAAAEQDAQSIGKASVPVPATPGVSQDSSQGAASTQLAPRSRRPRATNVAVGKLKTASPANTHEETQGQHTQELASLPAAEGVITDQRRPITFGKVFCTKTKPSCNACPMRSECRHFASAFASARLGLPAPEEKSLVYSSNQFNFQNGGLPTTNSAVLPQLEGWDFLANNSGPIIEEPESPREEERRETLESDIEDYDAAGSGEIPIIKLNLQAFSHNLENCIKESNDEFRADDIEKALGTEAASIPVPKLKNVHRLRTEHYAYELPDSHSLVQQLGLGPREPGDPSPYLLTIWMQDDIKELSEAPKPCCDSQMEAGLCKNKTCEYCVRERENQDRYVRGTILVPCRTAMKGRFPLNGTYFQVNEVFADHKSSHDPVLVVREQLWDLPRRVVYFGTSVPAIFKGLTTEEVQQCFWRGFVCVRGFDMETRAPRPLCPHLHLAASKFPRSRKSTAIDEHNSDPERPSVS